MAKLTLQQRLRAQYVQRWHIVNTTRPQSVAEHSFNVALITEEIMSLLGRGALYERAMIYAIHHDIPEVILGDIPTPVKAILDVDKSKYEQISIELDPKSVTANDAIRMMVKLADHADAIIFLGQHGADSHAVDVRSNIVKHAYEHIAECERSGAFSIDEIELLNDWLRGVTTW